MHKIEYTTLAENDLSNLFNIIYQDKPSVALEYINKLEAYIDLLEQNPFLGVECKTKNIDKNCRVLIYENYLIFYKVSNKSEILILRVLNSKINYQSKI